MFKRFLLITTALVVIPVGTTFAADADCLGKSCDDVATEAPFDIEADNDVFTLYNSAPEICAVAQELDAQGLSANDIIDTAVDVFIEEGLVTTEEGSFYLRGLVRGCLAG